MEEKQNYLKRIKKNKILLFFVLIFSFFISYFISSEINNNTATCYCDFQSNIVIDDSFLSLDNLEKIYQEKTNIDGKNSNYGFINISKMKNNNGIFFTSLDEDTYRITTYTKYYDKFFLSKSKSVSTRAKAFIKDLLEKSLDDVTFLNKNIITFSKSIVNEYLISSITMVCSFLGALVYVLFKKEKTDEHKQNIFLTPFNKKYWKDASTFLSSPKNISTFAMLLALLLTSKLIVLPSGFGNLGLSFGFIFISITCIMFGPLSGLLIGFLSDILGYFIFESTGSSFFIGYTLQAMLAGFSYGIFLYHNRITFFKVLINRLFVNIVCNVIIGSICWGIVAKYNFDQTMSYLLLVSLPKNLIFLIPQSIILFLIIRAILPILSRFKYVDEAISKNISII